MVDVVVGDCIRVYEEDDWFFQGEVTSAGDDDVVVDFGDWLQKYPQGAFVQLCECLRFYYVARHPGERLADYG